MNNKVDRVVMNYKDVEKDITRLKDNKKARVLARYFKTGKGEYGEGDVFLGISVPAQRQIAKKYIDLALGDIEMLLKNKIHEFRQTAIMILALKFQRANQIEKEKIYKFYLSRTNFINNWDLIDGSAPTIIGGYLAANPDKISVLYKLAKSKSIWEKRIAILATYEFIKNNKFDDTLKISEILLYDKHDLIHKAVGWMLREIGKRNKEAEEEFLRKYYKVMPRTMLRYAIEKFDEGKRKYYLSYG